MILNTSLHRWNDNYRDPTLDKDKKKEYGPNDTSVTILYSFL